VRRFPFDPFDNQCNVEFVESPTIFYGGNDWAIEDISWLGVMAAEPA
jgi:hypothetical protein